MRKSRDAGAKADSLSQMSSSSIVFPSALLVLVCAAGCTPTVMETRLAHHPAKPAGCPIAVLPDSSGASDYETIGNVSLVIESGSREPLGKSNLAEVQPRACKMGGDAIAVLQSATNDGGAVITYQVFRRAPAVAASTPAEEAYVISKQEPSSCKMVGGFFGYDTPCRNPYGPVADARQLACIRREITKAGGNYGVIDAVVGNGWYKGRVFACASGSPPNATLPGPATERL